MTERARLTLQLKQRAREAGFDAVGVARARELGRDGSALAAWLAEDRHALMAWMARDPRKRSDPRRLLPDCRSVVVVAMNYWAGSPSHRPRDRSARIARYAWGRDYHRVLGGKLRKLSAWLEATTGQPVRSFVDTGPVLERAWAERAGIGWIGKNANLLHRELGSWLLLGELLTAADLEPDPGPHADHCGSCTACVDACPTSAIVHDGVVDSNLCISYWTIEHRGAVPEHRRAGNGEWIFGCDVCQEVCPWNERFARPADGDPFQLRDELRATDPSEILRMDEPTFRKRFSGTSLMRAKWEGMRRNACIVLGNRGDPGALDDLSAVLDDSDPVIRDHAAWAIERIGGPRAEKILRQAGSIERS